MMKYSSGDWLRKTGSFLVCSRAAGWALLILVLILQAGCFPLTEDPQLPSSPLPPTGTKVILPATWTKPPSTATTTASITPTFTTSPTITPASITTPPLTPTIMPTEISLEPIPTTDWAVARLPDCTFTATETGVRILPAPFIDPYHVLPTMEPGKAYPAVLTKPTYTLLLDGRQPLGWVDYRLLALSSEGSECLTIYDEREIWDFPLCFLTPREEINGYSDSTFTTPMHSLSPSSSLVVLYQSERAYFTTYGSAGPSFVVKKEEVYTQGNCDDIPTLVKAIKETSLYSDLPSLGGVVIYTLEIDESIFAQSQQKSGPPPPGVGGSGYWVLARKPSWSEDINGWVWSGHIAEK